MNTLVGSLHVKSEAVTPLHSETQNAAIFQFSAEGTTLKSDSITYCTSSFLQNWS